MQHQKCVEKQQLWPIGLCTSSAAQKADRPDELLEHLSCLLLRTLRPIQSLQTSRPTGNNKADGTDAHTTKQLLDSYLFARQTAW